MTLGMAWVLCLVGTPVSIGVMALITILERNGRSRSNKSNN